MKLPQHENDRAIATVLTIIAVLCASYGLVLLAGWVIR